MARALAAELRDREACFYFGQIMVFWLRSVPRRLDWVQFLLFDLRPLLDSTVVVEFCASQTEPS